MKIVFNLWVCLFLGDAAYAQMMNWGTGYYGGNQSCQYPMTAGRGLAPQVDETQELREELSEMQRQIKEKKSEIKTQSREIQKLRTQVENQFSDSYGEFILEHIENERKCTEYLKPEKDVAVSSKGSEGDRQIVPLAVFEVRGFTSKEWEQVCDPTKAGSVTSVACSNVKFKALSASEERGPGGPSSGRRPRSSTSIGPGGTSQSCGKSVAEYRKKYLASQKLQREVESLEESIVSMKEEIKFVQQEARENSKNQVTEAGYCEECQMKSNGYAYQRGQSNTDWAGVMTNLGMGALATYAGYKNNQMVSEQNASLGWPTQSYPAIGYGYPYIMAGLYGALGGGTSQGAFGCGAGVGGTGNFNGAMGMMGSMGMNSPYASLGGSGAFGYPAGMMGNQYGGGMYMSGQGPWGYGGFGGSASMMGGMGFGMGNMMASYGNMMGAYGGMSSGYGNMMSGYGNMMSGYGGMMGSTGMDSNYIQYQQQLMQLQMQYQQQSSQAQLQKYQAVTALQSEMQSLVYRLQQIQYGYGASAYGTSSYAGGALSGTTNSYNYNSSLLLGPLPSAYTSTVTGTGR